MPTKPLKPCYCNGCPELTSKKYCDNHKHLNRKKSKHYNSHWRRIRSNFLKINPFCKECYKNNKLTAANEVHHIIPVYEGGTDDYDNLMALCKSCHSKITRKYIPKYKF